MTTISISTITLILIILIIIMVILMWEMDNLKEIWSVSLPIMKIWWISTESASIWKRRGRKEGWEANRGNKGNIQ